MSQNLNQKRKGPSTTGQQKANQLTQRPRKDRRKSHPTPSDNIHRRKGTDPQVAVRIQAGATRHITGDKPSGEDKSGDKSQIHGDGGPTRH